MAIQEDPEGIKISIEDDTNGPNEIPEEIFKEDFIKDLSFFSEGGIIEGTVVAVAQDSVFVDIGYKSEGEIPKKEFKGEPSRGEKIKVMILRMENKEGRLILSKQRADEVMLWSRIVKSYRESLPIEGRIVEKINGGFTVDIAGFKAFLPLSQLSRRIENLKDPLGKELFFRIDKVDGKNNIVLSRKKYLEELREKKICEFFETKKVGDIVDGFVKDIVNYGAFIDLGSIDGLLHESDISWGKVVDPRRYLDKNERISCKILSMDPINRKVSLGIKQLVPDPWESFKQNYQKGGKLRGAVTKLTNFGAFIELEPGIEGLLHVSELSWTKKIKHPKEILRVGQPVEVMLLDYDLEKRLVSLGLKQILPNPWDGIDALYPVGSRIKPKVTRVTKKGVFMELEEGIEGLISAEDISWTKTSKNLSEILKKDRSIEVIILSIDKDRKLIKLGMKQLTENPWENLKIKHPKGSIVTGTVTSITDFGVFVRVDEEIEGLIHVSQLSNQKIEGPHTLYKMGDEVKAIVLNIDQDKKKVTLSIKEYLNQLEEKEIDKYLESNSKPASVTLGDLIDLSNIGK